MQLISESVSCPESLNASAQSRDSTLESKAANFIFWSLQLQAAGGMAEGGRAAGELTGIEAFQPAEGATCEALQEVWSRRRESEASNTRAKTQFLHKL